MHDLSRAGSGIEQCRSWGLAFASLDGASLCKVLHGRDGVIQRVDLGHHHVAGATADRLRAIIGRRDLT